MKEIWKSCKSYPGFIVNQDGLLMNMETGRILGGHITRRGFPAYSEHRISHYVADAWLGGKKPGYEVRHKNSNILDNHPANLYFFKTPTAKPKVAGGFQPTSSPKPIKPSFQIDANSRKPPPLIPPTSFCLSFD